MAGDYHARRAIDAFDVYTMPRVALEEEVLRLRQFVSLLKWELANVEGPKDSPVSGGDSAVAVVAQPQAKGVC